MRPNSGAQMIPTRATSVNVALRAAKLSLHGLITIPRRRMRGSRVAVGDARSALALDARGRLRHLCPELKDLISIVLNH
jgi:hypothetical protein